MKRISIIFSIAVVLFSAGLTALPLASASAINVFSECNPNDPSANSSAVCQSKGDNATSMITTVINTLLYVLGIIAVIMIIVGGIRYTTSNGESSSIKSAKDTITYAVVGLVVAILAYAIVNFVVGRF